MLPSHNIWLDFFLCSCVHKQLQIISTLLILLIAVPVVAGDGQIRVMPRVDRSDLTVQVVLAAWADSLSQWRGVAPAELRYDRSAVPGSPRTVVTDWFSQTEDVVREFPPTILSIEPDGNQWVVRTMFSTVQEGSNHVIPLGILRTWFRFDEHGLLETVSPIERVSADWDQTVVGRVTYRTPKDHALDRARALEANRFLERTAAYFGVEPPSAVQMYVAPNRDRMCELFGLEYYAFPPSGMAFPQQGTIFSGLGDPYYPHELTHVVVHDLEEGAHPIISEGVATWLGGSITFDFQSLVTTYHAERETGDVPSFIELFTDDDIPQDDQYVLGAVLVDAVHRRHGADGVRQVLTSRTTSGAMLAISRMLNIDPSDQLGSLTPLIEESISAFRPQPGR